ncbi:acyl-ACP thioesterase domain-containing protein [Enterococcus sp. LJL98]
MGLTYEMPHEVAYWECDMYGRMTISMLVAVAIAASEKQSNLLERGTDAIHALGLNWIITDYDLTLARLPRVGEKVRFKTEATAYNRFFCYRSFWVFAEDGQELVKIETVFALMNQKTRKIARVQEEIIAPYKSEKLPSIKRMSNILPIEQGEAQAFQIHFFDLDENQHVNNAVYFNWLFAPLGFTFLTNHLPKKIRVRFEKEILYGCQVLSFFEVKKKEGTIETLHEIKVENEICCRAQMEWETSGDRD